MSSTDRILEITQRLHADVNEFLRRIEVTFYGDAVRFSRSDDSTRHVELETKKAGTMVTYHRAGGNITSSGPYAMEAALDVAATYVRELLID